MTHIADVEKVAICPVMYQAVCRCGQWKATERDVDTLRAKFQEHKNAIASDEFKRDLRRPI